MKVSFSMFLLFVTGFLYVSPVMAESGYIKHHNYNVNILEKQFQVSTGLNIELSSYLRSALKNGVTLNLQMRFNLGANRRWWVNKNILLKQVFFQLKYHELSRRYLLFRLDTKESWNFGSFSEAPIKLSEQRTYVLPKTNRRINNGKHYLYTTVDILPARVRLPIKVRSLFSKKYSLSSQGLLWPLR